MVVNIDDNCLKIKLIHEVTSSWVKDHMEQVRNTMENDKSYENVMVDMGKVEIIDSIGISLIIALYKKADELNKGFKVVGLNDRINNLFQMMKLDQIFPVEP